MYKLRRIGIRPAFKMGFAINTIVGLILGLLLLVLPALWGGMLFMPGYYRYGGDMPGLGGRHYWCTDQLCRALVIFRRARRHRRRDVRLHV